jgi:hypothetical protein
MKSGLISQTLDFEAQIIEAGGATNRGNLMEKTHRK